QSRTHQRIAAGVEIAAWLYCNSGDGRRAELRRKMLPNVTNFAGPRAPHSRRRATVRAIMDAMAHEMSLPAGDRCDAPPATEYRPVPHRTALVVALGDGRYFKNWRTRGGFNAVGNLKRA